MLKGTSIATLLALVLSPLALADDFDTYAKCAGYLKMRTLTLYLEQESAQPYAKDKYKTRIQYFMQGNLNLTKMAKRDSGFNQQKFDKLQDKTVEQIRAGFKNNPEASSTAFNEVLGQCVVLSGLKVEDYPR